MSTIQRVAQIFGWIFVVVAIWGFVVSGGKVIGAGTPAELQQSKSPLINQFMSGAADGR